MQKYVIVKFLEPVDDGFQYHMKDWPLHITLAPNFTINKTESEIIEILKIVALNSYSVKAVAGQDDYFGPDGQVHVTKLVMNAELQSLHTDLIKELKTAGAVFDEPQYIEDGFAAHVTVHNGKRLNVGDKALIDSLSLIDMFPGSDIRERRIIKTINLIDNN